MHHAVQKGIQLGALLAERTILLGSLASVPCMVPALACFNTRHRDGYTRSTSNGFLREK